MKMQFLPKLFERGPDLYELEPIMKYCARVLLHCCVTSNSDDREMEELNCQLGSFGNGNLSRRCGCCCSGTDYALKESKVVLPSMMIDIPMITGIT